MSKKGISNYEAPRLEEIIGSYTFQSDFYHIKNWAFDLIQESTITKGYNDCFCIVFVKKGNYYFDQHKKNDMHTGHIIIEKGNYEYSLRPASGECTIFNFTDAFYQQLVNDLNLRNAYFFSNPNIISQVILASPEIEYLHYQILKRAQEAGKLEMDNLVLEFLHLLIACFTNDTLFNELSSSNRFNHFSIIEKAKDYIIKNFAKDISLYEIANHCCISMFHFSRIFKKATTYSPYQFLNHIRLKHGEMLLKNTSASVTEIAFLCGFSSAERFATAFRIRYKMNPSQYRRQ